MGWRDSIAKVLAGKVGGPWEGGIRAYHSSPHDFNKVDFSKLRTGEGANVYGAGHYMAENPAVSGQGGQYWEQFLHRFPKAEESAAGSLKGHGFDREAAIAETRRNIEDWKSMIANPREFQKVSWPSEHDQLRYYEKMLAQREDELRLLEGGGPVGPRTYEMNLRAKPEELLDWDKPLRDQPLVRERINEGFASYPLDPGQTGAKIYGELASYPYVGGKSRDEAKRVISDRMAEVGIPGIRYLDANSRTLPSAADLERARLFMRDAENFGDPVTVRRAQKALTELESKPQQTYNYVGTDPSKLDILAKYGVAGAAPIGMGASYAQDRYEVPR